jgi:hypothetical protein
MGVKFLVFFDQPSYNIGDHDTFFKVSQNVQGLGPYDLTCSEVITMTRKFPFLFHGDVQNAKRNVVSRQTSSSF